MKVGITGGHGFLGWHLRCRLQILGFDEPLIADRVTMADPEALSRFVEQTDTIVHVAGVNRAADAAAVRTGNIEPAVALGAAIERSGAAKSVVYANSRKADGPGPYGESKRRAAEILRAASEANGGTLDDVLFPHLFGEFGRPHYNSAVHTFSHQFVHADTPRIDNDTELELLHAQDAAQLLADLCRAPSGKQHRPDGKRIYVSEALARIEGLATPYLASGAIPNLADRLDLQLFNLVRSHAIDGGCPIRFTVHGDERGDFYEVLRAGGQGQTSISTTVPGVTRGDHFHVDKVERFVVVSGEATIRLRRLFHDEISRFEVSSTEPVAIDMPPLTTHNITNTGTDELVTLFWSNDHFDPEHPDTYTEPVEQTEVVR